MEVEAVAAGGLQNIRKARLLMNRLQYCVSLLLIYPMFA